MADTPLSTSAIRPPEMMAAKQHCIEADRAFLLDRRDQWVPVHCPACDDAKPAPYGQKHGFTYVQCPKCATIYTNPRPSLDLLKAFYAQSANYAYWNEHIFPATETARRVNIYRPRADRVAAYCKKYGVTGGTLLEVGAAFGTFCEEMRDRKVVDRIIALEPTPGLAQTCRDRGFETLEEFIEDVADDQIADVIIAFEVLEHLFSPRDFIEHCIRLLRPGGVLILSCPNAQGFDVATLGTLSGTFDHEHVNYFNPRSLPMLAESCGLVDLDVCTPGLLDADLVRQQFLSGKLRREDHRFIAQILVDRWEELGASFQSFLSANNLSSHMLFAGRKPH